MLAFLLTFFALYIGHALADYPLQGLFLSDGKNRVKPLPGVPWYWCLGAHAAVHAGFVWAIVFLCGLYLSPHGLADARMLFNTGGCLGVMEFVAHFGIDDLKCQGQFGFDRDQVLHILCKLLWAIMLVVSLQ